MNPLSLAIIIRNRIRHVLQERKRLKTLEETIANVRFAHEKAITLSMPIHERIHNVSLYVLNIEHDISILRNDALFAVRPWKKNFIARQIAALIYEASQDIPELLGKDFRATLDSLSLSDEDWKIFNQITKRFSDFKASHRIVLKEVRNFVSSHRDKSAINQFKVLDKIDLLEMLRVAGDFYIPVRELASFMIKITLLLGEKRFLLRALSSNANK